MIVIVCGVFVCLCTNECSDVWINRLLYVNVFDNVLQLVIFSGMFFFCL